ncbi:MAG: phosphatase PAP2 family protein [Ilumatobacteraceae bacterium]|nr:phosphatase PAP2 family protein [Ilumatobacteraceae bacterium]
MSFDTAGDQLFERLRKKRIFISIFGIASTVGDFSIVWHVTGFLYALGSMHRLHQAIALSIALGAESIIVNQGVKRIFRRERPTVSGDERFDVRTPSTSSFPSGHASSATFAAIILISITGFPLAILWIIMAAIVALSRVVVRIHHLSDIVGGVITGAILGAIAVPIISSIIG